MSEATHSRRADPKNKWDDVHKTVSPGPDTQPMLNEHSSITMMQLPKSILDWDERIKLNLKSTIGQFWKGDLQSSKD